MTRPPTVADVLARVCKVSGIAARHIIGPMRTSQIGFARKAVYYLAHEETGKGYSIIGRALNRDQSTVRHGVAEGDFLYRTDADFRALVDQCRATGDLDEDIIAGVAERELAA